MSPTFALRLRVTRLWVARLAVIASVLCLTGCGSTGFEPPAEKYASPHMIVAATQAEALATAEKLRPVGGHIIRVLGTGSMYPTINQECFAVLKADFTNIAEGDICSVRFPPSVKAQYLPNMQADTLMHRVVHRWPLKNEVAWETRGDNWITNKRGDSFPLVRENYEGTAICFVTWKNANPSYACGMY